MGYSIHSLRVRNFKCFDNTKFYEFRFEPGRNPSILSGPNGFGKTTFFDAIEYIFTKKITRFQTGIEHGASNLGKNILLNEADHDGILILTLVKGTHYRTIISVIDKRKKKIAIESSLKYKVVEGILNIEDIEKYLGENEGWKTSLDEFKNIKYSKEHFNVYYYVSQAESVHFLKNSITERKDSMNVLLNTTGIDNDINFISNRLIGKSTANSGVIINNEIQKNNTLLDSKVASLRLLYNEFESNESTMEHSQLLNYDENIKPFAWEVCNPTFTRDGDVPDLKNAIQQIEALHQFAVNKSDFDKFLENEKINKVIESKATLKDFVDYHKYINNGSVNRAMIKDRILSLKKQVNIFSNSRFFRESMNYSYYKPEDLIILKQIDDKLITVDVDEITGIVNSINEAKKMLSHRQGILTNMDEARKKLYKLKKEMDESSAKCPFCNYDYGDVVELEKTFASLSQVLTSEKSAEARNIELLVKSLQEKLVDDSKRILKIVQDLDNLKIRELSKEQESFEEFIASEERLKRVENLFSLVANVDSWENLEKDEQITAIERELRSCLKTYDNPDFLEVLEKYYFKTIHKNYREIFLISQQDLCSEKLVENKVQYLKYQYSVSKTSEINALRKEIKELILHKKRLETIYEKLDEVRKIYRTSIENYQNQVLKILRVPLLIYSGKILQDYQKGLGVFISKDEMRFVSSGDAKHDILNTFSSGQLSGFVLAFLFAMNKQYIRESNDEIGFILIDDPVQTMDDINIASLVEVMRNDFSDKQIILSTHEADKENFILYKFLKYGIKGQSFDVKEKLYS